jgi:CheY-like chemotaxis protein
LRDESGTLRGFGKVARDLTERRALEQVFSNLITNAAKYTPDRGHIRVAVEESGGEVVVRVADTGVGIAAEYLPKIFDLFSQGQRTLDRSGGGLGLGLAIVRNLVELHGGSVHATSEGIGRGSEFTERLPRSIANEPLPSKTVVVDEVSRRPNGRKVLVVDDNRDAADMLAAALTRLGFQTEIATDGLAALHAAKHFRPEIVFLDIGLPIMDGYEVAVKLRGDFGAGLKLIALTGYGQASDREKAREVGFDAHIVKPIDISTLPELLSRETRP